MHTIKDVGLQCFHRSTFFEGWYYKLVLEEAQCTIALIPGVSKNNTDSHAFIQIFISPHNITRYVRFEFQECVVHNDPFHVQIGSNSFSLQHVKIQYSDSDLNLSLDCKITDITPIRTSCYSPTIMGPFYYVPRMQCNHGVISMNHWLSGDLIFNETFVSFSHQKGYIEKDWGTSFPKKYVWCQANNFHNPSVSVFLSIATIPMVLFTFKGLIANIVVDHKEYRFATYTFAHFKIVKIDELTRVITLTQGTLCAQLTIHSPKSVALVSPIKGKMLNLVKEGLQGTVHLKLTDKTRIIYDGLSIHGGAEFSGY